MKFSMFLGELCYVLIIFIVEWRGKVEVYGGNCCLGEVVFKLILNKRRVLVFKKENWLIL